MIAAPAAHRLMANNQAIRRADPDDSLELALVMSQAQSNPFRELIVAQTIRPMSSTAVVSQV